MRVSGGIDVALERRRQKAAQKAAWTVAELWRDFEKRAMPDFAPLTQKQTRSYYNTGLKSLESYMACDVTPDDAQTLLECVDAKRGYTASWQVRKVGLAVFKHAKDRRIVAVNPFAAVPMSAIRKKAPEVRRRVKLEDEELGQFLRGLGAIHEVDAAIFRLLLLTGVRAGELLSAEWADIDVEQAVWRIPRAKIKTRKHMPKGVESFDIKLPADAVSLFKRLHVLAGKSKWVIPSRARHTSTDAKPADHERVLDRLRSYTETLTDVRDFTLHDLRSTMRSHLPGLGVRFEVCERALNHTLGGMAKVYDVSDFADEREAALEKWAAKLRKLERGTPVIGKVVPLRA